MFYCDRGKNRNANDIDVCAVLYISISFTRRISRVDLYDVMTCDIEMYDEKRRLYFRKYFMKVRENRYDGKMFNVVSTRTISVEDVFLK